MKNGKFDQLGLRIAQEKLKQGTYLEAATRAKNQRKPTAAQGKNPAQPRVTIPQATRNNVAADDNNDVPYVPRASVMSKIPD